MSSQTIATYSQLNFLRTLARTRYIWPNMTCEETITKINTKVSQWNTVKTSLLISQTITANQRRGNYQIENIKRMLQSYSRNKAIFGNETNQEETIVRLEEFFSDKNKTLEEYQKLQQQAYRSDFYPETYTPYLLQKSDTEENKIPEGHYAVFDQTDTLRFYRIHIPSTGRNKNHKVIVRLAGDNLRPLYSEEVKHIVNQIHKNKDEASYLYSDTFTSCWVCGRSLTDSISRLLSIGPTCRGFTTHQSFKTIADNIDHNPVRREVFRKIRSWTLTKGFKDPVDREERKTINMSATRLASAWTGLPKIVELEPDNVIKTISQLYQPTELTPYLCEILETAPPDALLILIEAESLSINVIEHLMKNPNKTISNKAYNLFLEKLASP